MGMFAETIGAVLGPSFVAAYLFGLSKGFLAEMPKENVFRSY